MCAGGGCQWIEERCWRRMELNCSCKCGYAAAGAPGQPHTGNKFLESQAKLDERLKRLEE